MLLGQVINVADTLSDPIRSQVHAFRGQLLEAFTVYMRNCARSERLTICNALRKAGHPQLADTIWGQE